MNALDDLLATAAVNRLEEASASGGDTGLGVAVVVADVRPEVFHAATIGFALSVPADLGAAWRRTFTRTVFLAGLPRTVASRHPHRYAAPDGTLSWHGPASTGDLLGLSRLLRMFHGPAPVRPPAAPLTVTVPGTPTGHVAEATVATADVSVADYLVHTHHLFAEATLRGLIRAGDTVRIAHRPDLDGSVRPDLDPARADVVQTRIARDRRDTDRLRLHALLRSDRKGRH